MIAKQLYQTMGPALSSSADLSEVKAKDVFLAQESALPEDRHRKLISISQGFQAIRQKLKPILAKAAGTPQQEPLQAQSRQIEPKSPGQNTMEADNKTGATPISIEVPVGIPDTGRADAVASSESGHATQNGSRLNGATATVDVARPAFNADRSKERQGQPRDPRPADSLSKHKSATGHVGSMQQLPAPATKDFIEVVRPFITMVCEEFAKALVNVVSQPANINAMSAMLRRAIPPAGGIDRNKAGTGDPSLRRNEQHRSNPRQEPVLYKKADAVGNVYPETTVDDEEESDMDNDVQPLFDPKLPPSANSSFKPIVGVVGASPQDFSDLQQMYPQLSLTAIAVDDVPHAQALDQCQRVIGLREDVPAKTDEVLRQTFRNRYLRLTGGMARVREQLDAWLDQPGATEPRRPKFNKSRGNKGAGGAPKKHNGNFQRPPR
ncbi:hypothetical protein D3871_29065 [Noviherbaspirillum saxi]|uniref:Uncharacterized protein n=1 Tax=Noviherbaspirillum saxi TaxID=2320863 RepID=A0A3A3FJA3_9BURK|nr:hypothetical protein D3871_29065 [Noviherbaspirillum saxi]